MNKLLLKLLTTSILIYTLTLQFPAKGFSDTTATSQSTPTHQSSKKSSKKSPKKTSSKKSKKKAKKPIAAQPTPLTETAIPPHPEETTGGPSMSQLVTAYHYAYELYAAQQFIKAKEIFKKIALVTNQPALKSNSLYYYSQCAFRTEDYLGCVKALKLLVKKEPNCAAIKKGYVTRFCVFLIDQVATLQTHWDYSRYQVRVDEKGNPVWRESIPPGPKIKRINFRLGFGLYRVLHAIQPDSPEDVAANKKLHYMLSAPLSIVWVDEKAPETKYGHPADVLSVFSSNEKKHFSNVICERMFYDFQTEYFYKFLDMHDDVRNLRPRWVAVTKTPGKPGSGSDEPMPQNINEAPQAPPPPGEDAQPAPPALPAPAGSAPTTTALSTEEDPSRI